MLGAIIGVSLGQAMDASYWIFALTAGLFVYIALADMVSPPTSVWFSLEAVAFRFA